MNVAIAALVFSIVSLSATLFQMTANSPSLSVSPTDEVRFIVIKCPKGADMDEPVICRPEDCSKVCSLKDQIDSIESANAPTGVGL